VSPFGPVAALTVEIDSFFAGEAFPWHGGTLVAVDVIRSTTTAITAVELGRRCFAAGSEDEATALAARLSRPLLAGELRGDLVPGFHIGNSPAAIAARTDVHRPLVLLSSSGTALIAAAGRRSESVLVACLRNVSATIEYLAARGGSVVLLGAETRGEFRDEDQLCCAMIAAGLIAAGFWPAGPTEEIVDRWRDSRPEDIAGGASAGYLERSGQGEDIQFILEHIDDLDQAYLVRDGEIVAASASLRPGGRAETAAG
jgi:2-phosphosulfolactate phosphatase